MRRKLVWICEQRFRGWGCSECAWVFNPSGTPIGISLDEMKENYERQREREFASHVCAEHPRSPLGLMSDPCSVGHQWLQSESLSDAQDANQHLPEKVGDTSFEVILVELKTYPDEDPREQRGREFSASFLPFSSAVPLCRTIADSTEEKRGRGGGGNGHECERARSL